MRVTKIIREYVVKRVNEKFPKTQEENAWNDYQDKINDALTEANKKIEDFSKKVVEEINAKYDLHTDY